MKLARAIKFKTWTVLALIIAASGIANLGNPDPLQKEFEKILKEADKVLLLHQVSPNKTSGDRFVKLPDARLTQIENDLLAFKKKLEAASIDRGIEIDNSIAKEIKRREAIPSLSLWMDDYGEFCIVPGDAANGTSSAGSSSDKSCVKGLTHSGAPAPAAGTTQASTYDSKRDQILQITKELEKDIFNRLGVVAKRYLELQRRLYTNYLRNAHAHPELEARFDRLRFNNLNPLLDSRFAIHLRESDAGLRYNLWYPKTAYDNVSGDLSKLEMGLSPSDRVNAEEAALSEASTEYNYRKLFQLAVARERLVNFWGVDRSLSGHGIQNGNLNYCADQLLTLNVRVPPADLDLPDASKMGFFDHLYGEDSLYLYQHQLAALLSDDKNLSADLRFEKFLHENAPLNIDSYKNAIAQFFVGLPLWASTKAGLTEDQITDFNAQLESDLKTVQFDGANQLKAAMQALAETMNGPSDIMTHDAFAKRMSMAAEKFWKGIYVDALVRLSTTFQAVSVCEVEEELKMAKTETCLPYVELVSRAKRKVEQDFIKIGAAWRKSFVSILVTSMLSEAVGERVGDVRIKRRDELAKQLVYGLGLGYSGVQLQKAGETANKRERFRLSNASPAPISDVPDVKYIAPRNSDYAKAIATSPDQLSLFYYKKLSEFLAEDVPAKNIDRKSDRVPEKEEKNTKITKGLKRVVQALQEDKLVDRHMQALFAEVERSFFRNLSAFQIANPSAQPTAEQYKEFLYSGLGPIVLRAVKNFNAAVDQGESLPKQKMTQDEILKLGKGPLTEKAALEKKKEQPVKADAMSVAIAGFSQPPVKKKNGGSVRETTSTPVARGIPSGKHGFNESLEKKELFLNALAVLNLSGLITNGAIKLPPALQDKKSHVRIYQVETLQQIEQIVAPARSSDLGQRIFSSAYDQIILGKVFFQDALDQHPLFRLQWSGTPTARIYANSPTFMDYAMEKFEGDSAPSQEKLLSIANMVVRNGLKVAAEQLGHTRVEASWMPGPGAAKLVGKTLRSDLGDKLTEACNADPRDKATGTGRSNFARMFGGKAQTNIRALIAKKNEKFSDLDTKTYKRFQTGAEKLKEKMDPVVQVVGGLLMVMLLAALPGLAMGAAAWLGLGGVGSFAYGASLFKGLGIMREIYSLFQGTTALSSLFAGAAGAVFWSGVNALFLVHATLMLHVNCIVMPEQLKYQISIANTGTSTKSKGEASRETVAELSRMVSDGQSEAYLSAAMQVVFVPQMISPVRNFVRRFHNGKLERAMQRMAMDDESLKVLQSIKSRSWKDIRRGSPNATTAVKDYAAQLFESLKTAGRVSPLNLKLFENDALGNALLMKLISPRMNEVFHNVGGLDDLLVAEMTSLQRHVDHHNRAIDQLVERLGEGSEVFVSFREAAGRNMNEFFFKYLAGRPPVSVVHVKPRPINGVKNSAGGPVHAPTKGMVNEAAHRLVLKGQLEEKIEALQKVRDKLVSRTATSEGEAAGVIMQRSDPITLTGFTLQDLALVRDALTNELKRTSRFGIGNIGGLRVSFGDAQYMSIRSFTRDLDRLYQEVAPYLAQRLADAAQAFMTQEKAAQELGLDLSQLDEMELADRARVIEKAYESAMRRYHPAVFDRNKEAGLLGRMSREAARKKYQKAKEASLVLFKGE